MRKTEIKHDTTTITTKRTTTIITIIYYIYIGRDDCAVDSVVKLIICRDGRRIVCCAKTYSTEIDHFNIFFRVHPCNECTSYYSSKSRIAVSHIKVSNILLLLTIERRQD